MSPNARTNCPVRCLWHFPHVRCCPLGLRPFDLERSLLLCSCGLSREVRDLSCGAGASPPTAFWSCGRRASSVWPFPGGDAFCLPLFSSSWELCCLPGGRSLSVGTAMPARGGAGTSGRCAVLPTVRTLPRVRKRGGQRCRRQAARVIQAALQVTGGGLVAAIADSVVHWQDGATRGLVRRPAPCAQRY